MKKIKYNDLKLPNEYLETVDKLMQSAVNDNRIDKIILFGSCAKGTVSIGSDIDVCFLTKNNIDWKEQSELMDHDPACFPGCDLVILTPAMLDAGKDKAWGVTYWIIREGVELIGD